MKTLILYSSKYGATHEIAQMIADRMDKAVIHNLKQNNVPSIDGFDCIIIGSSLYAGMIRKEAKSFLTNNADSLRGKKLGLFLSGLQSKNEKTFFESNFFPEILRAAKAKCFAGGIYDPAKAGLLDKLIFKAVTKQASYTNTVDDMLIELFAAELRS